MILASLGLTLAACSGAGGSDSATLTATWSLRHIDGSAAMCAGGYTTIKISALAWNVDFDGPDPGTQPVTALFDCAAGMGTMSLPTTGELDSHTRSGKYDVTWSQTDATGQTEVATDLQTQLGVETAVDLSHGDASAATTMYLDDGYVWLEWGLFGVTANQGLASCQAGGVDRIDVALTNDDTMAVTPLSFPCTTADNTATGASGAVVDDLGMVGGGIAPVAAGSYSYVATAYAGATAVGTSDMSTLQVMSGNYVGILPDETSISITTR